MPAIIFAMMKKRLRKEQCDNCGVHFPKETNYCYNCGQENHSPNQPIKHLILEFFESLFHFDTKAFYSFKNMIIKPGLMTKEFISNKRVRYVPPIRLYIFVSAIFFIIATNFWTSDSELKSSKFDPELEDTVDLKFGPIVMKDIKDIQLRQKMTPSQLDSLLVVENKGEEVSRVYKMLHRQLIYISKGEETLLPNLIRLTIKYFSIILFILMPVFALLLWLVFYKRKRNYYEYLIFSIQYHTVCFAILTISFIISFFYESNWIILISFLLLLIYLHKSIRLNFDLARMKAMLLSIFIYSIYSLLIMTSIVFAFLGGLMFVH